ncbi:PaaI family thioesterase [Actinomadura barringtoniae]|uniref:Acyl-coenzyme A thioesterase THEM4 n=1 Tax=Actinomadura barringtoniae TaxID=1427535 RepID=A0A939T8D5_9ACTN|nr:PaaI family thioesterase [Actinomadura barringtoniae]MBO2446800.1 PaaI family thioesterase [Actinomadura barringtoniae]
MTGAGAAMRRVLEARAGVAPLGEAEVDVLAELAERVRELNEAVVFTGVDVDEIAAVRDEVAALTARLSVVRREHPPLAEARIGGMTRQLASPVSGVVNPIAPPVHIQTLPDGTARAEFQIGPIYEGPPSFVHGGVSAMILDQVLGMAASANGTPGMTATLELRYRRPTPHGVPLVAEGKVTRSEGRRTFADARILGPDGQVTVEATAMFVMPMR